MVREPKVKKKELHHTRKEAHTKKKGGRGEIRIIGSFVLFIRNLLLHYSSSVALVFFRSFERRKHILQKSYKYFNDPTKRKGVCILTIKSN